MSDVYADYRARRQAEYIRDGKEHLWQPWVPPMPAGYYERQSHHTGQDALAVCLDMYPDIADLYFDHLGGGQVIKGEVKGFTTREEVIGHCEVIGFRAPYREERW